MKYVAGKKSNGWVSVFQAHDCGCIANTEPVCTIPVDWHPAFLPWLLHQPCILTSSPLLWHPSCGQKPATFDEYKKGIVHPHKTGVFATEEEVASLMNALETPYLLGTGGVAPSSAQELAHRFALAHGLPEFSGFYGIDMETKEFLKP